MSFRKLLMGCMIVMALCLSFSTAWALKAGKTAPDWTAQDSDGQTRSLHDFKGKYVILEWTNHQCPYVQKHYQTRNMQKLQAKAASRDIIWLTIVSAAPGTQGYTDSSTTNIVRKQVGDKSKARILDPTGKIAKLYDAKTTPHLFVINPQGKIVYNGAIDDDTSFDKRTIKTAHNHIATTLNLIRAGGEFKNRNTTPYGCSIKTR